LTEHRLIRLERIASNGGSMWKCKTATNETINVFDNQLYLFAAYPEVGAMQQGEVRNWRFTPICVETTQKGAYLNVSNVLPRPPDACPDPVFIPDPVLVRSRAARWSQIVTNPRLKIVTWDTETTGVDPAVDELLSIGIVGHDGTVLLDTFIRPLDMRNMTVTNAFEINGITPEMVEDAPAFEDVYGVIKTLLDGRFWLGYNIQFDARMLDGACLRHGLTPLVSVGQHDATPFVAEFIGQWDPNAGRYPYLKLGEAAELFGIQVLDAHHAAVDAATTWEIVRIMAEGVSA